VSAHPQDIILPPGLSRSLEIHDWKKEDPLMNDVDVNATDISLLEIYGFSCFSRWGGGQGMGDGDVEAGGCSLLLFSQSTTTEHQKQKQKISIVVSWTSDHEENYAEKIITIIVDTTIKKASTNETAQQYF
jgi:hypothetical protein